MMISAHVGLIHCVPREEGFSSLVLVSHCAGVVALERATSPMRNGAGGLLVSRRL